MKFKAKLTIYLRLYKNKNYKVLTKLKIITKIKI